MASDNDELTTGERRALDEWAVVKPPAGFADRVLDARKRPMTSRMRRWPLVAGALATAAAAVIVFAVARGGHADDGSLAAAARTTAEIGDRATIVAEAQAALRWHVSASGAADIEQTAGDVFYRVERGGPFVIHTPAGDVRVTGTCLRIEVIDMKPTKEMLVSGVVGAALATAVVVTVYEGHVLADSHGAHTELAAGARATLSGDSAEIASARKAEQAPALATASREQLAELALARENQIVALKSQLAALEAKTGKRQSDEREEGRLWHDPSHDKLVEWAAQCHIRFDEPALDQFTPAKSAADLASLGVADGELDGYNSAISGVQKQWQALVRALYIEATGDAAGAESLSVEAMHNDIIAKSPPGESNAILKKIANERAGLAQPPADLSKTSPLERLMRAQASLGDQSEQALAAKVGAQRAHEIRGDAWGDRSDMSGCPK